MLKQLKYFQSVVRLGSFSAAAEENFISQSAISQQVQSLERELGFALLVRKNRSFSLTPAGEYFYRKSLLLTADCDRMCAEAAKIAKGEAANLKIGYLRTYAGGEFHRALAAFSARYPDVSVSIAYGSHGELCDMLSEDRVEITLNDQRRLFSDAYENLILAVRTALRPQPNRANGGGRTGRAQEFSLHSDRPAAGAGGGAGIQPHCTRLSK